MPRLATLLLVLMLVALPAAVTAQEEPTASEAQPGAADDGAAAEPDADSGEPALPEDADLDEQTYEENEDVFVPTEEIPSDEPIPFPTDI